MLGRSLIAALLCATATAAIAQESNPIFNPKASSDLSSQNIDANTRFLEALSRVAKTGPKFRISPEKVFIKTQTGEVSNQTVRISNTGDEDGEIRGINAIGVIPGLSVDNTCPETLSPGAYCDIAISFKSDDATKVVTSIVGTINERKKSSFDIPLDITVTAPAPKEQPAPAPKPTPVPTPAPAVDHKALQEQKNLAVARGYYAAMGYPSYRSPARGFAIVRSADSLAQNQIAGVPKSQISQQTVTHDQAYPDSVPSTKATLPVDRSRILTTDRVIKAVLDTPVSNVMCGKVVALVESDVYPSTGGPTPLIGKGSSLIGTCGQFAGERVGIAWTRIITNDGRSISLDADQNSTRDASGLGGGLGRVYQSNFDTYILPIFSTMIDTAAGIVQATFGENTNVVTDSNGNTTSSTSAKNQGLQIITNDARTTAQKFIKDIQDTRKIMVLPAGSRIDVELSKDIYFPKDKTVIKVADQLYNVPDQKRPTATSGAPANLSLTPWTPNATGPVVTVNGSRYVLSSAAASQEGSSTRQVLQDIAPEQASPSNAAPAPTPAAPASPVKPLGPQTAQQGSGSSSAQ